MNLRIRELALQVGVPSLWTVGTDKQGNQILEKFAELLIRETLIQMAVQMAKYGDEQSNNPAWYRSEETVKKYFGVKE